MYNTVELRGGGPRWWRVPSIREPNREDLITGHPVQPYPFHNVFGGKKSELEDIIRTMVIPVGMEVSLHYDTAVRSVRYRCRRLSTHDATGN